MIMATDDNKVVRLRTKGTVQLRAVQSSTTSGDQAIQPKSIMQMTDLELHAFIEQLRERRMRATKALKQAHEARTHAPLLSQQAKMERKVAAAEKALRTLDTALERFEALVKDARAMQLQYTDVTPT